MAIVEELPMCVCCRRGITPARQVQACQDARWSSATALMALAPRSRASRCLAEWNALAGELETPVCAVWSE